MDSKESNDPKQGTPFMYDSCEWNQEGQGVYYTIESEKADAVMPQHNWFDSDQEQDLYGQNNTMSSNDGTETARACEIFDRRSHVVRLELNQQHPDESVLYEEAAISKFLVQERQERKDTITFEEVEQDPPTSRVEEFHQERSGWKRKSPERGHSEFSVQAPANRSVSDEWLDVLTKIPRNQERQERKDTITFETSWAEDETAEQITSATSPKMPHSPVPPPPQPPHGAASNSRQANDFDESGGCDSESESSVEGNARSRRPEFGHQRGVHAQDNPEVQQQARDGQLHWKNKKLEVRNEWMSKGMGQIPWFKSQMEMCARSHIRSQHECLLRQLQMASVDGLVAPMNFTDNENESFAGWTGFHVGESSAVTFRLRIVQMFASTPNNKTLNHTLRRAGFIPEQPHGWKDVWSGVGRFVFDRATRVKHGRH